MGSWLLVSSPENFERSREIGFRTSAMKSRHRRKWERVRPGDRVFYYVTGEKAIGGIARVTGQPFESHERIWGSAAKPLEDYPWRFPTEPLAREMEYTKRWPAENWTLAFQGNVHELPDADADLVERAVRNAAPETVPA